MCWYNKIIVYNALIKWDISSKKFSKFEHFKVIPDYFCSKQQQCSSNTIQHACN